MDKQDAFEFILTKNKAAETLLGEEKIYGCLETVVSKYKQFISIGVGQDTEMVFLMHDVLVNIPNTDVVDIDMTDLRCLLAVAREEITAKGTGKITQIGDITTEIFDFYENGYDSGYTVAKWPQMSEYYRLAKRELTVVTGVPSHGKSEMMDAILVHLARDRGFKFALFSPENYPHQIHFEKFASKYTGKPFHQGPTERMTPDEVSQSLAWANDHFFFIDPDMSAVTLDNVLSLTKQAKEEHGVDGLLIDPWNELEHKRPAQQSETEYISDSLTKLRRFARHENIFLWLIAHPAKLHRDKDGKRPVPTPYDISGSAHWYNKADNCLTVYRNEDNTTALHIQKIRFKIHGKLGEVAFTYDKPTGIYTERDKMLQTGGFS